ATRMGVKLADYMVTEAGFGADLGAEKFFNIVCRYGKLRPHAVVLVASIRALKHHGGVVKEKLDEVNFVALEKGIENLNKHLENINKFGLPVVVALNKFPTDTPEEVQLLKDRCTNAGARVSISSVWGKGAAGGIELAEQVIAAAEQESDFRFLYDLNQSLKEKINAICQEIYGADAVRYSAEADKMLNKYEEMGYGNLPVCIAKTQYSLSDNAKLLGRPTGFEVSVREVRLSAGAGFIVALAGDIMTMPGLGKTPAAEKIDIKADGEIVGLF
ncbi:MAG: formate--tetrahydrofolate ligase, partial [Syntrophomonas sp.]